MTTPFTVENFSLLSPNRFQVAISRFPNLQYWARKVRLPDCELGTTHVSTSRFTDYSTPGDKIVYSDLTISFLIDEDMIAYRTLKKWQQEITQEQLNTERFSDLSILMLTNNQTENLEFKFLNAYPFGLGGLELDTGADENAPFLIDVSFKFSMWNITPEIAFSLDSNDWATIEQNDPQDFS